MIYCTHQSFGSAELKHAIGSILVPFVHTRQHHGAALDAIIHGLFQVPAHLHLVIPHTIA